MCVCVCVCVVLCCACLCLRLCACVRACVFEPFLFECCNTFCRPPQSVQGGVLALFVFVPFRIVPFMIAPFMTVPFMAVPFMTVLLMVVLPMLVPSMTVPFMIALFMIALFMKPRRRSASLVVRWTRWRTGSVVYTHSHARAVPVLQMRHHCWHNPAGVRARGV